MSISYANIAAGSKVPTEPSKEESINSISASVPAPSSELAATTDQAVLESTEEVSNKNTSDQPTNNSNSKKKKKDAEKSSEDPKPSETDAPAVAAAAAADSDADAAAVAPKKVNLTPAPIPTTSAWGSAKKSSSKSSIAAESSKWPTPSVEQPQQKKYSQPPLAKNTGKEKWVPFQANVQIASSKSNKPHNSKKSNRKKSAPSSSTSTSAANGGSASSASSAQQKSENPGTKPAKSSNNKNQKRKSDAKKDTKPTSDAVSKQKVTTGSEKPSTDAPVSGASIVASEPQELASSTVADASSEFVSSSAPTSAKSTESSSEQTSESASSNPNSNSQHSNKSHSSGYNNKFSNHHSNYNHYHGKNSRYPRSSNSHYKKQHANKHIYSNASNGAAPNMMYKQMQFTPGFIPQGVPMGYYDQFGYQGIPPPPMNKMHKGFPAGGVAMGTTPPFFAPQADFQYPTMPMRQFVPQQQPAEDLFELLTNQISYYFSTENLKKDLYLRKLMNSQGFVPIAKIASFFRVSKLTGGNYDMVIAAIEQTKGLEMRNHKVRLASDFESWVLPIEEREQEGKDEENEEESKNEEK